MSLTPLASSSVALSSASKAAVTYVRLPVVGQKIFGRPSPAPGPVSPSEFRPPASPPAAGRAFAEGEESAAPSGFCCLASPPAAGCGFAEEEDEPPLVSPFLGAPQPQAPHPQPKPQPPKPPPAGACAKDEPLAPPKAAPPAWPPAPWFGPPPAPWFGPPPAPAGPQTEFTAAA